MSNPNNLEPAQPLHTEHIHVTRKKKTPWLWLLVPIVALGLLALIFMNNRAEQQAVTPQGNAIVGEAIVGDAVVGDAVVGDAIVGDTRIVTYDNKKWEVKGGAETFPAGEVKLLGRSDEGDALYVHQSKGYKEGEGHEPVANTISTPSGRVYLKNADGRYQPLFQQP